MDHPADQDRPPGGSAGATDMAAALEAVPCGFSIFSEDLRLVWYNRQFLDLMGVDRDALRPGATLEEISELTIALGNHPGVSPAEFAAKSRAMLESIGPPGQVFRYVDDIRGRRMRTTIQRIAGVGWCASHEDVTEYETLIAAMSDRERESVERRQQFEAAIENMPQGVSVYDSGMRLIFCNRLYRDLYDLPTELTRPGTPLQDLLELRLSRGIVPDDGRENYVNSVLEVGRNSGSDAHLLRFPDGRRVSVYHRPMPDGGVVSSHRDVTEEIRAVEALESRELELKRDNLRFNAAISNMAHGLSMYDADFRLVVCNQNYIDMYAMPENLTRPGTHFDDVMAYRIASGATPIDGDKNFTTKVYEAARAHKTNLLTYRLKDGRIITITQQPMSDGGFVSTHEDITAEMARIEALEARESELEKSNLRFEAAVNNIAHGLVMFDRHQRVVICNKAYARLYNLPEELTRPGTTLTQIVENRVSQGIIRAADRDAMLRHWQDVGAAGKPHEEVVELADGRVVSLVHRPMSDGGWVATHEDITERRRAEAALAEAENRWKFALEGAGQGVWDADLVKGTMYYSPQWRLIRGFAPDAEINGSRASWLARVHPDDRQRLLEITDAQNAGTRPFDQFEYRERHQRTGEWIWILSRGKPISWQANGKPARIIGTDTDITRQKELELKLESNLALLHTTFENYPGGICLIDHNLILSLANANYYEMLGLDKDRFPPGTPLREIMTSLAERGYYGSGRTDDTVAGRLEFASRFEPVTFERRLADGRIFEFKRSPLPAGGFVQTIEDVTDARRNEERIRYLARHDQLTDLPNRMRFVEEMGHVEEAIRRGEKIAVIALDLDRFKTINDTLGHAAGDAVLRHVGNLINSVLRERDFAARLGGDEFAIIAYGVEEPAHAAKIAARIVQLLTKPLEVEGHRIMVGTSIGIAIAPNDGTETDVLMKNADLALYRAKAEGRGAYHFFQKGMDAALQRRRVIEEGLKQALARDEFRLVYQPIFDLKELKILGFEALLRWRSSSGEEIGPGEFIPVAEETGLILPIGEWVLRNACKTAASWPARVGVAVNISAVQFRARNLIELVTEALHSSGLEAERLELEITESLMLADSAHTLETLHGLRKLGVRISMDDFGTGYSSLAYFRSFPFDKIKIDRSFISELGRRQDNLAIITAVIGLSRSLGMSTIAEGIETEEQMQMLRAEGCEEAQGFLFSPPLPASAIPALLGADESLVRRPIGETA